MNLNRYRVILTTALVSTMLATTAMAGGLFDFGRRGERGSGDIVTQEREVPTFSRIRLDCSADLVVQVGEELSVSVTTDDNLQELIITEVVRKQTLIVDSEGSYRSRHGVQVEITVPTLEMIEVDGSGDVDISGLDCESFEVELDGSGSIDFGGRIDDLTVELDGSGQILIIDLEAKVVDLELSGSGDIEVEGRTEQLEVSLDGSGDIDSRRLEANDATVRIHGSGDVKVYARHIFDGAVYGSGDIDVYGDPEDFDRHESGSGDIRRR